jgi:hypothetical protein
VKDAHSSQDSIFRSDMRTGRLLCVLSLVLYASPAF